MYTYICIYRRVVPPKGHLLRAVLVPRPDLRGIEMCINSTLVRVRVIVIIVIVIVTVIVCDSNSNSNSNS